jgi:hypothetical protein
MTNISTRVKKLEAFKHAGNKLWYAEAVEGATDEWKLKLMLTET